MSLKDRSQRFISLKLLRFTLNYASLGSQMCVGPQDGQMACPCPTAGLHVSLRFRAASSVQPGSRPASAVTPLSRGLSSEEDVLPLTPRHPAALFV